MSEQQVNLTHDEANELLPWVLNGSLPESKADAVLRHVTDCLECRRERKHLELIQSEVCYDHASLSVPASDPERVFERIEAFEDRRARNPFVRLRSLSREHPLMAYAAKAAAVLIAVALLVFPNQQKPEFTTLTQTSPLPAGTYLRTVFQPDISAVSIGELLGELKLQIVSGPSERGVYTLAMTQVRGSADHSALAAQLRAHNSVLFTEVVDIGGEQ